MKRKIYICGLFYFFSHLNINNFFFVFSFQDITEQSAEYPVKLRKIFFDDNIVLEFIVGNTLEDTTITDVRVELKFESEEMEEVQMVSVNEIKTNTSGSVFITIATHPEHKIVLGNF